MSVKFSTWLSKAGSTIACGLSAVSGHVAAQPVPQGGIQGDPGSVAASETETREIIVTASRRETTIRETPTAISAYSGEQLARSNIVSFTDLVVESPNIQLGSNDSNTNIAIRGIGSNLQTAGNDPGVAFHVDGIYLPDPFLARLAFLDVARVEVLRGPQGTLFGRNATGGVINIISNTPTVIPEVGFRITAGFPLGEQLQVFASTPLNADATVLTRFSMQQTYQNGRLRNLSPVGPRRFDGRNDYAVRGQLEFRPSETFRIRIQGDYQLSDTPGPAPYLAGSVSGVLPPLLATTRFSTPKDDDVVYLTKGKTEVESYGLGVFATLDIGGGALNGTFSRRNSNVSTVRDGDGTLFEFNSTLIDAPRKTTFAELLYASDDDKPFSVVLGANYYDDNQKQDLRVPVFFLPFPVAFTGDVDSRSYAFFGQAQYDLTAAWKIFGGARYSNDRKRIFETNVFIGQLRQSDTFSKVTYEAGTSFDITPSATAYLKYATGYKGGGYSSGSLAPAFRPETNGMVEFGLKGSFFDRKLSANLAIFRISYDDLQVNQVLDVQASVTNAAKATIYGGELELNARLTPELSLLFAGGYLNARFDEFITADSARPTLGTLNLKGNRLAQSPEFTLGGGPVFDSQLSNGARFNLSARYDWKSRVFFSEFNLRANSQASTGRLSASANYTTPNGKWKVGLYGRNLTDERIYNSQLVYASVLNSIIVGNLEPRREFGIQLSYRN